MFKIGLTGNRYAGKDKVADAFKSIGIPVYDADVIIRFILKYDYFILGEIRKKCGSSFGSRGELSIKNIIENKSFGSIVRLLENQLFSAYERFHANNSNSIYTIFHSSILFETHWDRKMDYNINVFAPKHDRVRRCYLATGSDNLYKITNLAKSEMVDARKNEKSDYIIYSTTNDIIDRVNQIDKIIVDDYLIDKQSELLEDDSNQLFI